MAGKLQPPLPTSWDSEAGHRAILPHAATQSEPLGLIRKGWGASPNKWNSIMMHKIAIGLAAAAIATAGSTLSASAFPGGGGGESAIHGGGGAYFDAARFGGYGRGGYGRGGYGRGGYGHRY